MSVFYFYLSSFYLDFTTEFIEKRTYPVVYTCTDNDDFVSFFNGFLFLQDEGDAVCWCAQSLYIAN